MAKIAYFECPTGIAGDMCLGALVDGGVPLDYLQQNLDKLGISQEFSLTAESVLRQGQQATKVQVELAIAPARSHLSNVPDHVHHSDHVHAKTHTHPIEQAHPLDHSSHDHPNVRHLPEIEQIIVNAGLPARVTQWSLQIFRQLAVAESAVHGIVPEAVHFHEVGATDAIVDIVGTCLGLDWLGIEAIYCSPLPTGGSSVKAAHGILPVPAPAVVKLWEFRQVPVYSNGIAKELVTPTGAAIAVTLAQSFGEPPAMSLQRMGLGAGSKDFAIPNILRLWIGESAQIQAKDLFWQQETIAILETQIDDLNPQIISYLFEILYLAGALEVFTQAIGMKKSRLGILLTVICPLDKQTDCETIIFRETPTIGIRHRQQQRSLLQREIVQIITDFGEISLKIASYQQVNQRIIANVKPEYEDCARLAQKYQRPWQEIYQHALDCWNRQQSS
jgi:hypothetical protein